MSRDGPAMPLTKPIAPNSAGTASGRHGARTPIAERDQRRQPEAGADDALAARRVGREEAADHHAAGARRPCRP